MQRTVRNGSTISNRGEKHAPSRLRDFDAGCYFRLRNAILDPEKFPDLTTTDILVRAAIASFTYTEDEGCFPSRKKLARRARCCKAQVSRSVKKMEERGILYVERREATTNRYWLLDPEKDSGKEGGSNVSDKHRRPDLGEVADDLRSGGDGMRSLGRGVRPVGDDITAAKQNEHEKTAEKKMDLRKPPPSPRAGETDLSLSVSSTEQVEARGRVNAYRKQPEVKPTGGESLLERTGENEILVSVNAGNHSPEGGDAEERSQPLLNELRAHLPQSDLDDHLPRLRADLRELLRNLPKTNSGEASMREKSRAVTVATFGVERWKDLDPTDREAIVNIFRDLYQSTEWHFGHRDWIMPFVAFSIAAHVDSENRITPSHIRAVAARIRNEGPDEIQSNGSQNRGPNGIEEVVDLAIEVKNDGELSTERNVHSRELATGAALRYYHTFDPKDWTDKDGQPIRSWHAHARHWLKGFVDDISRADSRAMRDAAKDWMERQ